MMKQMPSSVSVWPRYANDYEKARYRMVSPWQRWPTTSTLQICRHQSEPPHPREPPRLHVLSGWSQRHAQPTRVIALARSRGHRLRINSTQQAEYLLLLQQAQGGQFHCVNNGPMGYLAHSSG